MNNDFFFLSKQNLVFNTLSLFHKDHFKYPQKSIENEKKISAKLVYKIQEYDHIIHHLRQERRFLRKEYDYVKKIMNQPDTFHPYVMEDASVGALHINEQTYKQRSLYFSKLFHTPIHAHENGAAGDHRLKPRGRHGLVSQIEEVLPIKPEALPIKQQPPRPKTKDKNVMVGKRGCVKFEDRHFSGGFFMFIICLF